VSEFCLAFCENAAKDINNADKQIINDFILLILCFEKIELLAHTYVASEIKKHKIKF
jgi:hypothetical protein